MIPNIMNPARTVDPMDPDVRGPRTEAPRGAGSIVLVANFDSNVGFAWWLIEAYWAEIAWAQAPRRKVYLAFPSISEIPESIAKAPIECIELDFSDESAAGRARVETFLSQQQIETLYWSDGPLLDRRYASFRRSGVRRIIVHSHRPALPTQNGWVRRQMKQLVHRWGAFSADDYVAVSNYVGNQLEASAGVPATRVQRVCSGIDVERLDLHETTVPSLPEADLRVALVCRADPGKGLEFALGVAGRLKAMRDAASGPFPKIHFVHIGTGTRHDQIASRLTDMGLTDCFSLLGYQEQVGAILRACDIGFHPSESEVGHCLAILEMLSQRLPVVLPRIDSVSSSLEGSDCWAGYAEGDEEGAAEQILSLAVDAPRRQQMGELGRSLVEQEFEISESLERFRDDVLPLFDARRLESH